VVQTLVENAVKHGIAKSLDGGEIIIEVTPATDTRFQLKVSNTGEPFANLDNNGTGLANTRARLELLYGNRHQFNVGKEESGRTVASFYFTGEKID
jgi:two-component system, LytTR family, sensor kinase